LSTIVCICLVGLTVSDLIQFFEEKESYKMKNEHLWKIIGLFLPTFSFGTCLMLAYSWTVDPNIDIGSSKGSIVPIQETVASNSSTYTH